MRNRRRAETIIPKTSNPMFLDTHCRITQPICSSRRHPVTGTAGTRSNSFAAAVAQRPDTYCYAIVPVPVSRSPLIRHDVATFDPGISTGTDPNVKPVTTPR